MVRIKGDCPFVDPAIIDQAVRQALSSGAAYTSNRALRTYPRGLEVEVVTVEALHEAAAATTPDEAAVRSPFARMRDRGDRYPQSHCLAKRDLSGLDWRVKTPADFAFAWHVQRGGPWKLRTCGATPSRTAPVPHALDVFGFILRGDAMLRAGDGVSGYEWEYAPAVAAQRRGSAV